MIHIDRDNVSIKGSGDAIMTEFALLVSTLHEKVPAVVIRDAVDIGLEYRTIVKEEPERKVFVLRTKDEE